LKSQFYHNRTFKILQYRYKSDGSAKIKHLKTKIEHKEAEYNHSVLPKYEDAKLSFENLLTLKGVDLLYEWGIFDQEFRQMKVIEKFRESIGHSHQHISKKGKSKTMRGFKLKNCKFID
jgi:hypothetical protein